jgi:hypothetical protein
MNTKNELWNSYCQISLPTAHLGQERAQRGGLNAPFSKPIGFESPYAKKVP